MKALLSCVLVLFLFGKEAISQCNPTPVPRGFPGFCPAPSAFPCIARGQQYSEIIQFESLDSLSGPFTNVSVTIDSIVGAPSGISFQVLPDDSFFTGETGCIIVFGQTNAPVGNYTLSVYVTINLVPLGVIGSMELTDFMMQMIALGLMDSSQTETPFLEKYYLRVVNQGDPCPTSGICQGDENLISGTVFFDVNSNGNMDLNDAPMAGVRVNVSPGNLALYTNQNGFYRALVGIGTFSAIAIPPSNYSVSGTPSYQITFNGVREDSTGKNFGLTPDVSFDDLSISITGSPARPGFITTHWIEYVNQGTSVMTGAITHEFDPLLTFVSSVPPPTSQSGNTVTWDYSNLHPWQRGSITVQLQVPVGANFIGDTLHSTVTIYPDDDATNLNRDNQDAVFQIITGSYDPNDKLVSPDDTKNGVRPDDVLTYTVRFQNTGSDTAFTVVIRDTLDNYLDASSFKTICASNPYSFQLEGNKFAIWTFDNILLPDSGINEPESHGFVKYSIAVKNGVPHQTNIQNSASIYFDFNEPVKTNTTQSRVDLNSGIRGVDLIQSNLFPNPASEIFTLELSRYLDDFDLQLLDVSGKVVKMLEGLSGNSLVFDVGNLENGIYLYRVTMSGNSLSRGKLVVLK